nr:putative ribonuclease H-like domain-containing protein [Tanacetum cinerariifolium]
MKKAILRMLARVFRSEQFDREMVKVQKVFDKRRRELGSQEARDLLVTNQPLPGCDPYIPRTVKDIFRGFKKTKWECMESLTSSSDLSPSLLHSVLDHGDSVAGEGVFRSEQFDREMVKVQKVFDKRGRELGSQEARDLLMANQPLPGCDPYIPRTVKDIFRGFKKTKWECMESLTSSSDLSPSLLHSVLDHGDSVAGEGTGRIIGRGTQRDGLYYVDEVVQSSTMMLAHGLLKEKRGYGTED